MKNTADHDQMRRVSAALRLVQLRPDRPGAPFPHDATFHMPVMHPDHENAKSEFVHSRGLA
jgi:hypothetical protein